MIEPFRYDDRWVPFKLALDVGVMGALAVLDTKQNALSLWDIPYKKIPIQQPTGKRKIRSAPDYEKWLLMLAPFGGGSAIVEEITSFRNSKWPANEVTLNLAFGAWQMAFAATRIEVEAVNPKSWKAFIFQGLGGAQAEKNESVKLARKLFPAAEKALLLSRDGRADALCMLYYLLLGERLRFKLKAESKKQPIAFRPIECKFTEMSAIAV